MALLDLANLHACFFEEPQLAAVSLQRRVVGQLPVSSGRLVVCDPLAYPETPPLADYVAPPGRHMVEIITASGRPALSVVWFQPRLTLTAASLRWQMARWSAQDASTLENDYYIGYPVDAGVGCFMDADTQQALLALIEQHTDEDRQWCDELIYHDGLDEGAMYRPWGETSPHAVAVFTSGWGDGAYPSYWALDAGGAPAALITDFLTIEAGDGRDEDEIAQQAYNDSLSLSEKEALVRLATAVEEEDLPVIEALLIDDPLRANRINPESGGTALFEAIRLDKPLAFQVLLQGQVLPPMPEQLHAHGMVSYPEYARILKVPRSTALMALVELAPKIEVASPSFWNRLFRR